MKDLKRPQMLRSQRTSRRNIITALIAGRAVNPQSKLAAFREISGPNRTRTLADITGLDEDLRQRDIYEALDWLLMRQNAIEKKLAARHLKNGSFVLYDLPSGMKDGIVHWPNGDTPGTAGGADSRLRQVCFVTSTDIRLPWRSLRETGLTPQRYPVD